MTLDRTWRTLAFLATACVALLLSVAAPPSAAAQAAALTSDCDAEQRTIQWAVPDLGAYTLTEVLAEPAGSELSGFGQLPAEQDGSLTISQQLPPGASSGGLTVRIMVDGSPDELTGEQSCDPPPAADLIGGIVFDCQWLTVTLTNPRDDAVRLTVLPHGGDPVDVEVAGGRSTEVQFPAAPGLSVDVTLGGRSIVDPAEPITITPAQWGGLECDQTGGEAAGLPATGSRVALVIVGALALLGLGGGLYLLARRRRIRFTA